METHSEAVSNKLGGRQGYEGINDNQKDCWRTQNRDGGRSLSKLIMVARRERSLELLSRKGLKICITVRKYVHRLCQSVS